FCCFSLCVDWELVCAEGCTQVTGVMAMMMTGRVLMVCALCVLWCGAGSGGSSETTPLEPASQDDKGPKTVNDTPGGAGKGVQTDKQAALQTEAAQSLPQKEPKAKAEPTLITEAQSSGNEKQGPEENEQQKEDESVEEEVDEEGDEDEEGEEEEEEEGAEDEKDDDDKEDNEAEKKKKDEKDTNTTKRMSAGGQEPTSLTSGEEGASNKTNLKNTQTLDD
ncbi:mucin-associated surface protein (MASP), putative, partial [Trypanosoma cruzi marinkellei]